MVTTRRPRKNGALRTGPLGRSPPAGLRLSIYADKLPTVRVPLLQPLPPPPSSSSCHGSSAALCARDRRRFPSCLLPPRALPKPLLASPLSRTPCRHRPLPPRVPELQCADKKATAAELIRRAHSAIYSPHPSSPSTPASSPPSTSPPQPLIRARELPLASHHHHGSRTASLKFELARAPSPFIPLQRDPQAKARLLPSSPPSPVAHGAVPKTARSRRPPWSKARPTPTSSTSVRCGDGRGSVSRARRWSERGERWPESPGTVAGVRGRLCLAGAGEVEDDDQPGGPHHLATPPVSRTVESTPGPRTF